MAYRILPVLFCEDQKDTTTIAVQKYWRSEACSQWIFDSQTQLVHIPKVNSITEKPVCYYLQLASHKVRYRNPHLNFILKKWQMPLLTFPPWDTEMQCANKRPFSSFCSMEPSTCYFPEYCYKKPSHHSRRS